MLFTGAIFLVGGALLPRIGSRFSCSNPDFKLVTVGMTKAEVEAIFGKFHKTKINPPGGKNFMGQGYNSNIAEAWIYSFLLWSGNVEIYFDSNGKVTGRNCGYG